MSEDKMSTVSIPREQWSDFLDNFSQRHAGWLASLETHDIETGETVSSRYMPLENIVLDTEDARNPRINVTVESDNKLIKHVFFRPTHVALELWRDGENESLHVQSLNTSTTVRFRNAGTSVLERAG
jgi:Family of unknown function (DUF5335)